MPQCPHCGEDLGSHSGRNWHYFHRQVLDGPYPNQQPHPCPLVNEAFTQDGRIVLGYGEARKALVEALHGHKKDGV